MIYKFNEHDSDIEKFIDKSTQTRNYSSNSYINIDVYYLESDGQYLLSDSKKIQLSEILNTDIILQSYNNSITIDIKKLLKKYFNLQNIGQYKVESFIYNKILFSSDSNNSYFIKTISPSRKELEIRPININNINLISSFTEKYFPQYSLKYKFGIYIEFDNDNNYYLIVNSKHQDVQGTKSLILKMYDIIPEQYNEKSPFVIIEALSDVYEELFYNSGEEIALDVFKLKPPDFNNIKLIHTDNETPRINYSSLVNSSDANIKDWVYLLASNDFTSDLGVDYSVYSNFINFSSITQRILNFRNKLENLEYYQSLQLSTEISGSYVDTSSKYYEEKRKEIIST